MPCGSIDLGINVYDRESESVAALFERMGLDFEKIGIRAARNILTDNAGISIFRNRFRIRPYGEPENDWLELERQRVQNPSKKLGLTQVSGRVTIEDEATSNLIERSSREGLEHNGAFERLKRLLHGVLVHVEERRLWKTTWTSSCATKPSSTALAATPTATPCLAAALRRKNWLS